jgi:hypothetical protein
MTNDQLNPIKFKVFDLFNEIYQRKSISLTFYAEKPYPFFYTCHYICIVIKINIIVILQFLGTINLNSNIKQLNKN